MTNKEINRESGRFFEGRLLPSWAWRSQEDQEDYGVDGEIEVTTPEDKATGLIFKVQLKGTSVANYDESGQLIYSEASVERFTYYVSELKIPIVFVVCDVKTGDCFWTRVQGNRHLEGALNSAVENGQKTFTIKFPAARKILKTAESSGEVLEAVESASDIITLRRLQNVSRGSFGEYIGQEPDLQATEKQFRLFAGLTASKAISKLIKSGDFENAVKKATELFESQSEAIEVRLLGGLSLAHAINGALRNLGAPDASIKAAGIKFGIASKMLVISRSKDCEPRNKRYARIFARAARMQINARVAMALAFSENVQKQQGATISGPLTSLQRMEVSALIAKDFFRLHNALYRLSAGNFYSVMPYALAEIAESINSFVRSLRILGRDDLANAYIEALFGFLPFCVSVVRRFDSQSDAGEILTSLGIRLVGLANPSDKSSMPGLLKRYEGALEGEPSFGCLNEVLGALRNFVHDVETAEAADKAGGVISVNEARSHYAQLAAELGINLNDPNDRFAEAVRIGLEDLDPTRVLKNCQHIHVMVTSYGMPGEMLGLTTAGSKRIVCLKHGHGLEGLKLDDVYAHFSKRSPWIKNQVCCENCPDKTPHDDRWQWSEEWSNVQNAKYQQLMRRPEPE